MLKTEIRKDIAERLCLFLFLTFCFGSFVVKYRKEKVGRIISKNESITIPAHYVPSFKPAKVFVEKVKSADVKPV